MTPIHDPHMTISRLSVAALEDLGYLVNYNGASSYNASDIKSECVCTGIDSETSGQDRPLDRPTNEPSEAKQKAIEFGKSLLLQNQLESVGFREEDNLVYVAGDWISVVYKESTGDGRIAYAVVTADDL